MTEDFGVFVGAGETKRQTEKTEAQKTVGTLAVLFFLTLEGTEIQDFLKF